MVSCEQLFHSIFFLPLIILFTFPFHLLVLFPQAYLLLESTRPFGFTTIYLIALDFHPPWPFSFLIPFNFPTSLGHCRTYSVSADTCHSVPAFSFGLPCDTATLHSCPCLSCDEVEGSAKGFSVILMDFPGENTYVFTYIIMVTRLLLKEEGIGEKNNW